MSCLNHLDRKTYAKGLCKSCYHRSLREANVEHAEKQRDYFAKLYAQNKEVKKAQSKAWVEANKARKAENDSKYRLAHKARRNKLISEWKRRNPSRVTATNAARRAMAKKATPAWADLSAIRDVYLEAGYMQMHVDHIVPLNHPLVCGLHVWDNLQPLTPEQNMRKNNRFNPENYHAH